MHALIAESHAARWPARLLFGAVILFAGFVLLAACGDDDDDETPTSAPSSPTSGQTESPTSEATTPAASPTTGTTTSPTQGGATTTPGPTLEPGDTDPKDLNSDPDPITGVATLTDLRMAGHDEDGGYDRIVFDFDGDLRPSATIEYVDSVSQCGSGQDVTLEGDAVLVVRMFDAQAHTPQGQPTLDFHEIDPPADVETILEGVQFCDFEGQVEWAFGLSGEQPFRAFTLEDPQRIVVDIER